MISQRVFFYIFCIILISLHLRADVDQYIYGERAGSLNIFGETGLIVIPSAESMPEGSIAFNFSKNDIFKFGSISVAPFQWLEASYFYYRPSDLWWGGPATKGLYLDKGFSVKLSNRFTEELTLAIGVSDFAGTGFFTREYLIGTYQFENLKISLGMGFGKFANGSSIQNPLGFFLKEFKYRPTSSKNFNSGGSISYDQLFRGNLNFIGGIEYFLGGSLKNLSIKIDNDPFDYANDFSVNGFMGQNYDLRKKKSDINLGLNFNFTQNFKLATSFIKGDTFNLSFTLSGNFSKPFFKKKKINITSVDSNKGTTPKESFYEDLLVNINNKGIYLQTSEIDKRNLKVAVSSNKFRDPILVHATLGRTAFESNKKFELPIDTLTTINVNVGHELNRISTPLDLFEDKESSVAEIASVSSQLEAGNGDSYRTYEFRPIINYPASFTGIAPSIVNHIGDPAKFYYGGLVLLIDNETQLSSRLQINTTIHHDIFNNFDEKSNRPDSILPRVRTDIVSYLQQSATYISRMQLDYFFNPYQEIFGKFSAGILEDMYLGAGVEFLYKPFEKNFSIGLESYRAKKRAFDRRFDVLDYETNTGHINFNYYLPRWGILGTLSYGKYLAGDIGYTFDISRRLTSGFRTGFFFTRTNVSAEQFGEGSFDKGFYFQIPIDLFLNDYRGGYINFKLRPLTRDGGQKLQAGNDLIGIMHTTSRAEIERDWGSFND